MMAEFVDGSRRMDNGWVISLLNIQLSEFNKSIIQYPNKKRFRTETSNDMIPNLPNPENPLLYDPMKVQKTIGARTRARPQRLP